MPDFVSKLDILKQPSESVYREPSLESCDVKYTYDEKFYMYRVMRYFLCSTLITGVFFAL
ncbi:hypothetical protein SIPHO041v1_p0063 [Vibrio phage 234P1]|nr:hypothetical protein SIPHO041v1_p0063 [Vibrio phage 234P1]QZI88144.1 hypothetical protein SIPHO035v1_p0053 [Vibrio phage 234P7B]QZI88388.1 hypothetical protein SIPHO082v1_p0111 [Vibrio phage 294E48.1]QZI88512.1 hypothetical protein SIPHO037v1_p0071 [Vibrio phage 70E35.2]QZI88696.1 hypothetical protein SIPHO039v1_p0067 [Vibrio phage 70E35.5a]QZI88881.1 hypothetical protein SIPHO040v1_p0068 [Vibrio phage 70E35.6]QZI89328.1 hypothetical protein SIPHO038v1_p0150 [Vibrio phage 70E37.6]